MQEHGSVVRPLPAPPPIARLGSPMLEPEKHHQSDPKSTTDKVQASGLVPTAGTSVPSTTRLQQDPMITFSLPATATPNEIPFISPVVSPEFSPDSDQAQMLNDLENSTADLSISLGPPALDLELNEKQEVVSPRLRYAQAAADAAAAAEGYHTRARKASQLLRVFRADKPLDHQTQQPQSKLGPAEIEQANKSRSKNRRKSEDRSRRLGSVPESVDDLDLEEKPILEHGDRIERADTRNKSTTFSKSKSERRNSQIVGTPNDVASATYIIHQQPRHDHSSDDDDQSEDEVLPMSIELVPYKHQVGGHTALFRFSHRAVCKAMAKRENLWYEAVEENHSDLLRFMPKYIGVLNVRHVVESSEDDEADPQDNQLNSTSGNPSPAPGSNPGTPGGSKRHSMTPAEGTADKQRFPEVVFNDNRHIIPESIIRKYSSSAPEDSGFPLTMTSPSQELSDSPRSRKTTSPFAGSTYVTTGATTINRQLQEQVLKEVFASQSSHRRVTSFSNNDRHNQHNNHHNHHHHHNNNIHSQSRRIRNGTSPRRLSASRSPQIAPATSAVSDGETSADVSPAGGSTGRDDNTLFPIDDIPELRTRPASTPLDSPRTSNVAPDSGSKSPKRIHKKTRIERFLLLEDLTADMVHPCVLDLKMGTRQYGVEATAKKQQSQMKKCATTTSRRLGVRVCGMQVWNARTQTYIYRDKYEGRKLREGDEFQTCLREFLTGYSSLTDQGADESATIFRHVPRILRKLHEIETIISRLIGYRLYGSSLLLMYDAANPKGKINLRIIDFAQCVVAGDPVLINAPCPPRHPDQPDLGYIRGIRSLQRYFFRIGKGALTSAPASTSPKSFEEIYDKATIAAGSEYNSNALLRDILDADMDRISKEDDPSF
ncbi:uncharacterized protein V1516DRAFT_663286 [Lipomyces oligophaga]|uniref:uncharacterized protein n=1 Tax=Lipomyces oligophaga TaxID=45792 RepID=UPI0034CDAD10